MSTLADELSEAANCLENDKLHRLADRLRQRAAWVRKMGAQPANPDADAVEMFRALTGHDVPAETAPSERTET